MRTAVGATPSLVARVAARVYGPTDVWLLSRMVGWALRLAVLKRRRELPALVRLVRRGSDGGPRRRVEEDQIVTFARWATRLTQWTDRGNCVERGLIAYRYLTAINARPMLVVGVGRDQQSAITGHVWIELDSQPVGERLSALRELTPILTFGPDGEKVSLVERLVVDLLRGEAPEIAPVAEHAQALVNYCRRQGVASLVADRLAGRSDVPPLLRTALASEAQREAVADMLREPELRLMLAALADAGVDALVFKGAQLAYTLYPRPDLRPRLDTDILIPLAARARTHAVLTTLGYVASDKVSGELSISQKAYAKTVDGVELHAVDVHWRIACPQAFAQVLGFDELRASALPIPALGPDARGLSLVHAVLLACIHRVAHHRDSPQLKWLYDLHLLVPRLSDKEWLTLQKEAVAGGVVEVVMDGVGATAAALPSDVIVRRLALLAEGRPEPGRAERSALYLRDTTPAQRLADDLRRLGGWRPRLRLLLEHLFPSPEYMRRMYAPASSAPLPVLYLTRIARGAIVWLRMTPADTKGQK